MLFLYILLIKSDKPLFFAPGFGISELRATITKPENFHNCTGDFNHKPISRAKDITNECRDSLLDTVYDKTTGIFSYPDGVIIETDPIQEGYNNSYILLYDWTLYYPGTNDNFLTLKNAIEQNYTATNEKIILVGYSMGTSFMRYFTTEYNTKECVQ